MLRMARKKGVFTIHTRYSNQVEKLKEVKKTLEKIGTKNVRIHNEPYFMGVILPQLIFNGDNYDLERINAGISITGCEIYNSGYRFGRGSDLFLVRTIGKKSRGQLQGWTGEESKIDKLGEES